MFFGSLTPGSNTQNYSLKNERTAPLKEAKASQETPRSSLIILEKGLGFRGEGWGLGC